MLFVWNTGQVHGISADADVFFPYSGFHLLWLGAVVGLPGRVLLCWEQLLKKGRRQKAALICHEPPTPLPPRWPGQIHLEHTPLSRAQALWDSGRAYSYPLPHA